MKTTTAEDDLPVSMKNFNVQQIREQAITQSTKPSGSEPTQAKLSPAGASQDATQALTIKSTINNNMMGSGGHVVKQQQQQQVTKRLVYTQYRELLKRYEQSSRL